MSYSDDFYSKIRRPHNRVDPCFMTGKGCVYTEVIDRTLKENRNKNKYTAFAIMPLRQNLGVFYQNCLVPFFKGNYSTSTASNPETLEIGRGDQIRRPGVIICEGICKRIQESNFVIADISLPNPNVFYELGLAYGIGQKLVVICHHEAKFGETTSNDLKNADCLVHFYTDLEPIRVERFDVSQHIWERLPDEIEDSSAHPRVFLFEKLDDEYSAEIIDAKQDIRLDFSAHVMSAVGLSIDKIYRELEAEGEPSKVIKNYLTIIEKLKIADKVKEGANFKDVRKQVDSSYCMIVRTGKNCHPMAYFWLGYGHARGKNVIPITVIKEPRDPVDDLAFDIRSQRHMTFVEKAPELLETELEQTFRQMIWSDFSEWSRKRFWDEILGRRGEVSIFTGALHNKDFDREMIGDWDLRAVSELTSYFGRNQYRARIDTPVYAPEYANPKDKAEFIGQLKEMIQGKNCILIASPDVNPLTEIVLGHIYGVPEEKLFSEPIETGAYPNAIITLKEKLESPNTKKQCALYCEKLATKGHPGRGFASNQIPRGSITERFISQADQQSSFYVYAHLAIVPNPFGSETQRRRYIIILNGVSGPATFALTHVLTGGVNEEFVSYDEGFDPEAQSEVVLSRIIADGLQNHQFKALECIIKVHVGPLQDPARKHGISTFDWRRILGWELEEKALGRAIRVLR